MEKQWIITGASVKGNYHIENDIPCQDACTFETIDESWNIAVVSDGADSSTLSQHGSKYIVEHAPAIFKDSFTSNNWDKKLPSEKEWRESAVASLRKLYEGLSAYALEKNHEIADLSATVIIALFSHDALLTVHVGDGRAGFLNKDNIWVPAITPFNGEEIGTTVFLTCDIWDDDELIETNIYPEPINGVTLLTDGAENSCWVTLKKEDEKILKENIPFQDFFHHNTKTLDSLFKKTSEEEVSKLWSGYLLDGNQGFQTENDDKTVVLAYYTSKEEENESNLDK